MSMDKYKCDDLKRKLRELKKIEMKIRSSEFKPQSDSRNSNHDSNLVWNQFFSLKNIVSKHVKYSFLELSEMTKEELKD